jgi:hypothetical protein
MNGERRNTLIARGHGQKYHRLRERAISELISRPTILEAARACGIAEGTLRRWMKNEDFSRDYEHARSRVLDIASEKLRNGALMSVDVLSEVCRNKKASPAARVTAARSFLEATGLLRGLGVVINNQVAPTDLGSAVTTLLSELESLLSTNEQFRLTMRSMLDRIELQESEGENVARPN